MTAIDGSQPGGLNHDELRINDAVAVCSKAFGIKMTILYSDTGRKKDNTKFIGTIPDI